MLACSKDDARADRAIRQQRKTNFDFSIARNESEFFKATFPQMKRPSDLERISSDRLAIAKIPIDKRSEKRHRGNVTFLFTTQVTHMRETFVVEVPKLIYPHVFMPKPQAAPHKQETRYMCWLPVAALPEKYHEALDVHIVNARSRDGSNVLRDHISAASLHPPMVLESSGRHSALINTLRIAQDCRAPIDTLIEDTPARLRITIYDRQEPVQALVGSRRTFQAHRLQLDAVAVDVTLVRERWQRLLSVVFLETAKPAEPPEQQATGSESNAD